MAISYKKLWKLLIDKDMTAVELREKTGIAPNTMTKLRRDEEVSMTVLIKICKVLNANIGDTLYFSCWFGLFMSSLILPQKGTSANSFQS